MKRSAGPPCSYHAPTMLRRAAAPPHRRKSRVHTRSLRGDGAFWGGAIGPLTAPAGRAGRGPHLEDRGSKGPSVYHS